MLNGSAVYAQYTECGVADWNPDTDSYSESTARTFAFSSPERCLKCTNGIVPCPQHGSTIDHICCDHNAGGVSHDYLGF